MDKKIKLLAAGALGTTVFMGFGYSFFEMMVRCKRKRTADGQFVEQKNNARNSVFSLKHIQYNHPRYGYEEEYEVGKQWVLDTPMEDYYIESLDHLKLHARYLKADNAKRIVILCHGYHGSSQGDFANMAKYLHENGCNLLLIDERCCGESEGEFITFGAREKYDIKDWAYFMASKNPSKLPIYLYGESMGAAAVLMTTGLRLPKEVKGIISDCGFISMKEQMRSMADNWFHIKRIDLLLMRVEFFCRTIAGFSMKEADAAEALRQTDIPVLFFHGADDTFVYPKNTLDNYIACKSEKEMYIVSGARHLCSNYVEHNLYRDKVEKFFEKYD